MQPIFYHYIKVIKTLAQVSCRHSQKIFSLMIVLLCVSACSTTKKIKDGRTAFQQKQYAKAVGYLEDDAARTEGTPEYAEIAYLLGESYKNLNESELSMKWYIEAAKNEYGPEAYWEMAYALKKNERYEDAILSFRRLDRLVDRRREIALEIEKCKQAQRWAQENSEHEYIVEAVVLNSDESDYAPSIWQGNKIVFTSDRLENGTDTYAWTGNSFSDIYFSDIYQYEAIPMDNRINTPSNEGTSSFTADGKTMYFTRCHSEVGDSYCKIYRAELNESGWGKPEEAFRMKPKVLYRDPVLIENDSVLIFTSNDQIGVGGHDLYYSFLIEEGVWSEPELMPTYLNTTGQERFPTWDQKSKTLYYSSDHFTGLGGLDIFKTTLKDDGSWSKPENLLPPFNSSEDDYGLVFIEEDYLDPTLKSKAFFTSTRGAYGNDDIYSIVEEYPEDYIPPADTSVTVVEVEEPEEEKTFFLRIKVLEKLYAISDNPNSYVVGSRKIGGASVKIESETISDIYQTDGNGYIIVTMDSSMQYSLLAGKEGYLNNRDVYVVDEGQLSERPDGYVFEKEIIIDKVFEGVEIVIDNIYYDLDKSDIRDDAKPALDKIIEILDENPKLVIELASHTDCQGEDNYNLDLSERRAASALAYIKTQGAISDDRLSSVGYGETNLEISCECDDCSDEEHQINRRTTFKVIR